jgi:hypothetical protein
VLYKNGKQILMVQAFGTAFFRYLFSIWKTRLLLSDYTFKWLLQNCSREDIRPIAARPAATGY